MKKMISFRVAWFISLVIVFSLLSTNVNAKKIKPNSVYVISLKGTLIDYKEKSKFSDIIPVMLGFKPNNTIGLNNLLKNIKVAAQNPDIKGIYLYGGELSGGYASMKEFRDALLDFKKSGKFIVAYADNYSQSNYYLACVADRIMFNPYGSINIKGLESKTTFYKNTIDKLGIEMQVVKVGTYKSAVEPYTTTRMSDPNREQLNVLLSSVWKNLTDEMSVSRKLNPDTINLIADKFCALLPGKEIRNYNLVDTLVYADQTDTIINAFVFTDRNKKVNKIGHSMFTSMNKKSKKQPDKIAVIYANGSIAADGEINSTAMIRICKDLETNKSVKAVVLRVNSPGGSAFESEKIWRAVSQLKLKKPVVVSMGNVAASGGYYISCNASRIFAEPTTITGSIGIFGMFPNMKGLNDKLGLSYDGVKTNKMSDAYSTERGFTEEERTLMEENINRGYELFVKRCADGRHKTVEEIKSIAEGRVWTGENAVKNGLVDECGSLNDAIKYAAGISNTENYEELVVLLKSGNNDVAFTSVYSKIEQQILENSLGKYYQLFKDMNGFEKQDRIQTRLLYDINME